LRQEVFSHKRRTKLQRAVLLRHCPESKRGTHSLRFKEEQACNISFIPGNQNLLGFNCRFDFVEQGQLFAKAIKSALEEIHETANAARYYGRASPRHLRPRYRRGALPVLTDAREYHRPVGVVGVIAPWNFPLILGITDALPALAAGCGVVVKLDSRTPYSALWAGRLLETAGLPPGLLAFVTGSGEQLGSPLIDRVDYVMFTGSTRVGREVATRCAERLIGCSLELGGKNAMLVLDDADLDRAVEGAIAAKYRNAGQTCVCTNRFLVQDGIYDAFAERLAAAAGKLKVGNGLEDGVQQGPLIDDKAVAKVEEHIADAVQKGGKVVAGGHRHALGHTFFEPTIITGATSEMAVAREETFGPLSPLFRFKDEAEAVRMANDTEYGLASYFYTRDLGRAFRVSEALEYGLVGVNEGLITTEVAPFGGVKESGVGREGSKYGIEDYLSVKYTCVGGLD